MRWTRGHRSAHVEDRRGQRVRGGGGLAMGAGKLGIGATVVLLLLSTVLGVDLTGIVGGTADQGAYIVEGPVQSTPAEDETVQFVSFVLDDAQANWAKTFEARGRQYEPATLVLFRDATPTACGFGQSATGPFYCPGDAKVYIDLGFFDELGTRFGASGDFAKAYVLAHEIG